MPTPADESRILRARSAATRDALDRRATDRPGGGGRYVGQVYAGPSFPTSVPRVFLTHPYSASADPEAEGSMVSASMDATASVPVVVLGPTVPAVGDVVIAKLIDGYWVAGSGTSGCRGTICVTVLTPDPYGDTPVSGATVTVYDGPTTAGAVLDTCTTDSAGRCCVDISSAKTYAVKVEKGGCSATTTVAATCAGNDVVFYYCSPTVTFHVADSYTGDPVAGADIAFTGGPTGLADGTTDASGDYAVTYCLLGTSRSLSSSTALVVSAGGTYLDICRPVQALDCSTRTVNLLMADTDNYVAAGCCPDGGCSDGTPGSRGLVAKTLYVRFTGANFAPFPVVSTFGTDEGAWIPVVWDGVTHADGSRSFFSACRPGNGQTSHDNGCFFTTPYGSTRVQLELCRQVPPAVAPLSVSYTRYSSADCSVPGVSFTPCGCDRLSGVWHDVCSTVGTYFPTYPQPCSPTGLGFEAKIGGVTVATVDVQE